MVEESAPEGEKEAGKEEQFAPRLVQVNPNVIEDRRRKDKTPHCYFKRWRRLNLHAKDYEFVRVYRSLDTDLGHVFSDIVDEAREDQGLEPVVVNDEERERRQKRREFRNLAKRARENFDALSEEEQSEIRWAHLKDVQPAEQRRLLGLVGWAEIERSRSIKVFSVATKEEADEIQYNNTFGWVFFSIQEKENDAVGHLMHWTEELRRYDDDDPGEDYLNAEMYVKEGTLAKLEHEIRQRGGDVPLGISVEAHLFQYEVEEGLAEPFHSQDYYMVYDTDCSIILNSIRVGSVPKLGTEDSESENHLDEEVQEDQPDPHAQFRERMLSGISNLGISLKHIQIALWVVAAVLFVSLFV